MWENAFDTSKYYISQQKQQYFIQVKKAGTLTFLKRHNNYLYFHKESVLLVMPKFICEPFTLNETTAFT